MHLNMAQYKPFNPIWGETFQCNIGNNRMFIEQTSHHPPIYNYVMDGKNYVKYGYEEIKAETGANSVTVSAIGKREIKFTDGTVHSVITPRAVSTGITLGDRTYNIYGSLYVIDHENDFIAIIDFNPDERGMLGKWFSSKDSYPDYFKGKITRLSHCKFNKTELTYTPREKATTFVKISGEWTEYCSFDDEKYWDRNSAVYAKLTSMKYILPSDSTLRLDRNALIEDNEEKAQTLKHQLEEIQRNDRKLRKTGKKH